MPSNHWVGLSFDYTNVTEICCLSSLPYFYLSICAMSLHLSLRKDSNMGIAQKLTVLVFGLAFAFVAAIVVLTF